MLLDCIRAFAILAVLVYHVAQRYEPSDLDYVARVARQFGLLGVDIFFPLSGYLITRILLRASDTSSVKVFFQRRFFRIVPLYMAAVTAFVVASLLLGFERENLERIWMTYLFLTGWFIFFDGTELIPYTITWSLSVEEFAYLLFGLCAWLSRKAFFPFLVVLSAGALALRLYLNLNGYEGVYNFPPARLDSVAMGGIVAMLMARRAPGLGLVLAGLALFTYITALWAPELWSSLKYTFITLGTCALIVLFDSREQQPDSRGISWLSAIGFYSYFTYLFHLFNIHLLLELAERYYPGGVAPFWLVCALALAMTQIQAVVSFRLFEGPVMRYGRSLEPRRPMV